MSCSVVGFACRRYEAVLAKHEDIGANNRLLEEVKKMIEQLITRLAGQANMDPD